MPHLCRSMTTDNNGLRFQRRAFASARNCGLGVGAPIGFPRAGVSPLDLFGYAWWLSLLGSLEPATAGCW